MGLINKYDLATDGPHLTKGIPCGFEMEYATMNADQTQANN